MKQLTPKTARAAWAIALALPLALLVFLAAITTLSADDYWYAVFFRQGLGHYFSLMAEHYQTFNGRMLVHFFAQLTLALGNWAFALVCGGLTVLLGVLAAKAGEKNPAPLLTAALFCAGVMLLPKEYFVTTYLWVSAFFNYVFPSAMLMLELVLLERLSRCQPRPWGMGLLLLYAFLCGATTEQSGAVAVAVALCVGLEALLFRKDKKQLGLCLGAALAAALGLLTIFLSPATLERAKSEIGVSLLHRLLTGLKEESFYFFGGVQSVLLLSVLFLAVGWLFRRCRRNPLLPALCALLPWAGLLLPHRSGAAGLCLLLVFAGLGLCAAVLFFRTEERLPAYFILMGLGDAAVILLTNSVAERTLLPTLIFFLAAIARIVASLLSSRFLSSALLAGGLALAAVAVTAPHLPAYLYNYQVEQENLAYIRELKTSGVLYCNLDYDMEHTYSKMTSNGVFYRRYLEYAGFTEGTDQLIFLSSGSYTVYVDGARYHFPAYPVDGQLLLHTRALEPLGGTVEYAQGRVDIRLGDRACAVENGQILWADSAGTQQSAPLTAVPHLEAFTFLPAGFCTEVLGVEVSVDESARTVSLSLQPPLQP